MITYDTIKTIAGEQGLKIADLCALAPKNDPFYTGRPSEVTAAQWFAHLYQQFGYGSGVHLRRIHYRVVSQETAITRPDGTPYHNTDRDWNYLNEASKWARYLDLVPPDNFIDRRNPDAIIHAQYYDPDHPWYEDVTPRYHVDADIDEALEEYTLPGLPTLDGLPYELPRWPEFDVSGYEGDLQPYHVEIWCEKTTMNDVLEPLCRLYHCNLVTGAGEMSITSCVDFLKRVRQANKSARILYISDYDPAGLGMPISVARKLEYFQRNEGYHDIDIRLQPICLTREQVAEYNLPRVPVKDSDLRKANFEAAHGSGQVELDALESLYPGQLAQLVEQQIRRYYDWSLGRRARDIKGQLEAALLLAAHDATQPHQDEIEAIQSEYESLLEDYEQTQQRFDDLVADFQGDIDQYHERLQSIRDWFSDVYGKLEADLGTITIDLEDYALPEAQLPDDPDNLLYISERDYVDQLYYYKAYREGVSTNGHN